MNRRYENQSQQPDRYPQQEWSDDDYRGGNRYRANQPYASGEDQYESSRQGGSRYQASERSPSYGDYESERDTSQRGGSYYGSSRDEDYGSSRGNDYGSQNYGSQNYASQSGRQAAGNYGGSQAGYSRSQNYNAGSSYGQGGSSAQGGNYGGLGQRSYGSEYGAGSQSGRGGYQSSEDRNQGGYYSQNDNRNPMYGTQNFGRDFGNQRDFGQGYGGSSYGSQRYGNDFSQSSGGYDQGSYDRDAMTGSWGQSRSDFNQSGGYGSGYSQVGSRTQGGQSQQQRGFSGKGPKGYTRSDDRLKEDINERLTDDFAIDASEISVEVKNGTVTLTGTVDERWMKHHVEDVVDRCSGVQDIENKLTVSRSGSSAASGSSASTGAGGSTTGTGSSTSTATGSTSSRKQ